DVYWTTDLASSAKPTYVGWQGDGNLVVYSSTWGALWASNTNGSGANNLVISGCSFALENGSTSYYTRGSASCNRASISNSPSWSITKSGTLTLLQSDEAALKWQSDGNLVLYTNQGAALWATNTNGSGNTLTLQGDGNLVIYSSAGKALWASGTNGN